MAKIGRISLGRPAWQNFDSSKAKLTKNQKEALKRKELQQLCREAVKKEKLKYAFYQVNRYDLGELIGRNIIHTPETKAISRFV